MMLLTESVAAAMKEKGTEIVDQTIDSRLVEQLSATIFGVEIPIAVLLLCGFVVPVDFRRRSRV